MLPQRTSYKTELSQQNVPHAVFTSLSIFVPSCEVQCTDDFNTLDCRLNNIKDFCEMFLIEL